MIYTSLTKKAMVLMYNVHQDQTDKMGIPYVFHPFHIAEQMDDEYSTVTALLHDVIEDSPVTVDDLRPDFPAEICDAIDVLTRHHDEDYFKYIERIKGNAIAKKVKLADLRHNSDPSRLDGEPDMIMMQRFEKYHKAYKLLCENDSAPTAQAEEKRNMKEKKFTLASFNICSARFVLGKYTEENLALVVEKIKGSGADVVAMQEVDMSAQRSNEVDMTSEIARGVGFEHNYFIKIRDFQGGEYGTAIISRFPIKESKTFNFQTSIAKQGTSCGYVVLDVNGEDVAIFNTHLSYESEEANTETLVCLHDILREYYAGNSDGFICCGDFNTDPGKLEQHIRWTEIANHDLLTYDHSRAIDNMICCGQYKLENGRIEDTTSDSTSDHDMLLFDVYF